MEHHNLISIDLAKDVFQVCGFSNNQKVIFNKQIKRNALLPFIAQHSPTDIVMEACYSSHYWARSFEALDNSVKLLPAQHVTPFVRGNKSDRNDAVAIAEASLRPNIISVPIKSVEQQDIQSLHRIRDRYVANRTGLSNQARGLLSEYGVVTRAGHKAFTQLLGEVTQANCDVISPMMKEIMLNIADEYHMLCTMITKVNLTLNRIANTNPSCQILMSIPGIGVINATAIYSAIGTGNQFKNGRDFAVWLGLTPRQASSGTTFKSGGITKRGNRYLRKQLVHGARSLISRRKNQSDRLSQWGNEIRERRGFNKASVAMAARLARLSWVLLQKQEPYQSQVLN